MEMPVFWNTDNGDIFSLALGILKDGDLRLSLAHKVEWTMSISLLFSEFWHFFYSVTAVKYTIVPVQRNTF